MTEGGMEGAFLAQFQYLLAGFVAAWVFYGLTPYKRPTPFERIVQALVYTAVVQLLTTGITDAARFVGWEWVGGFLLGPGGVFVSAILIGGGFAWLVNRDYPHSWLRNKLGLTSQTARKCNWADAFDLDNYEYIILNLKDGRRLYGWPFYWPNHHSDSDDHFLLKDYAWLPNQGGEAPNFPEIPLARDAAILVASEAVDTVEFLFDKTNGSPEKGDPS